MTEQDKNLIIRLWESGCTQTEIIRLLPYSIVKSRNMILELRKNGVLQGKSGKSASKTIEKIVRIYKEITTNPYEIAQIVGLRVSTVDVLLTKAKLNRKRPSKNYKKKERNGKAKAIIKELKQGEKMVDIANRYGVSRQYVHSLKKSLTEEEINATNQW